MKQRAYLELKEFFVIVLYLWVVLALVLLYKSVLLNEEHISFLTQGFAIINALVLGKVILIARALHLGDRYNHLPLIYSTFVKSALFSIVLAKATVKPGSELFREFTQQLQRKWHSGVGCTRPLARRVA